MRKVSLIVVGGLIAVVCAGCATGQTRSPVSVSDSGAVVGGRVVSDVGGQVEYWAQSGATKAYGSETAHQTTTVAKNAPADVQVTISGLARSAVYHYRLCATDSDQRGGPGCGADQTLKTQSVACGETVTANVRLTGDLVCENFTSGLVIGASGLDINLAGHEIRGPIFVGGSGPPGLVNTGGFDDVTIRNGNLGGWGDAIQLEGASHNRVLDVDAQGASNAILIRGGDSNEIRRSHATGRSVGISVAGSDHVVVANSSASGFFGAAITLDSNFSRVADNEVGSDGFRGSQAGIRLLGSHNRIVGNRVRGFAAGGIVVAGGSDNVVGQNEAAQGFLFADPNDTTGPRGDGIFVGPFTAGTLLRANNAHDNAGDGIEVQAPVTRLKDNTANNNGDLGIDAVAGVTDLGGNTASGNGNPLQCRNVFCQ